MSVRRRGTALDADAVVVGGGLVGATLASLLARAGLRTAVIEAAEPQPPPSPEEDRERVLALTRASEGILGAAGAWERLDQKRLGHFRSMEVWDAAGSGSIRFDAAALCEPTLGYIAGSRMLQSALESALATQPLVAWHRPRKLIELHTDADSVTVELDDNTRLRASLAIGADGASSLVRRLAGIDDHCRSYGQHALVCSVRTEREHGDAARQRFLPTGPLAFLPLADPHWCSIVWSIGPDDAGQLLEASEEEFSRRLREAFDARLGAIIRVGPRAAYPLTRAHAERYVHPRLALVGDAAHRIHPLAGQGANLGLLDAASLAEVLEQAVAAGRDPGRLPVLRRYERWRRGENLAMQLAMDGFKHLFGSQSLLLRRLRNTGLRLTDSAPPVKRLIMLRAMGLIGDLPRIACAP